MKYKLTDETMTTDGGALLHRIECICSFGYGYTSETWTIADSKEQLPKIGDIIKQ